MDTELVSSTNALTDEGPCSSGGRLGMARVKVRAWEKDVRLSPRYDVGKERVNIGLSSGDPTAKKPLK
jgi:hypothetical protein